MAKAKAKIWAWTIPPRASLLGFEPQPAYSMPETRWNLPCAFAAVPIDANRDGQIDGDGFADDSDVIIQLADET